MQKLAHEHGYTTVDDLLAGLGYGKTSVRQVVGKLAPADGPRGGQRSRIRGRRRRPRSREGAVTVKGVDDVLVRFAKCCGPVPGDPIVGFITRGRGMTVHARDCLTVVKNVLDKERFITVEWDGGEPTKRPVKIAVHIGRDRPGLLADISGAISSRQGNIVKAEVTVTEDRKG